MTLVAEDSGTTLQSWRGGEMKKSKMIICDGYSIVVQKNEKISDGYSSGVFFVNF